MQSLRRIAAAVAQQSAPLSAALLRGSVALQLQQRLNAGSLVGRQSLASVPISRMLMTSPGIGNMVGMLTSSKALVEARKIVSGERSVGVVHRGKLRGNVKEAWEHREILRLTAARDPTLFDDFEVGDHVVVRHMDVDAPGRYLTFGGVCIAKYGGSKLMRSFRLLNHVDGVGVEMHFAYFSPHIKGIQLLRKKTRRTNRAKWYFLRDKPPKEWTVTWSEKELKLPRPPKV